MISMDQICLITKIASHQLHLLLVQVLNQTIEPTFY